MRKVLYIALADDGSSYYRIQGVLPFINHEIITLTDISYSNINSWSTYVGSHTLILQRPCLPEHVGIITMAQSMGLKVIIDHDDNVMQVPNFNPAYELYNGNKKHVRQCIRIADEIWCSTGAIKNELSKYNNNIHVIPNAHNDYLFPVERKRNFNPENKLITYRGGETHRLDIFEKLNDLAMVINEYPNYEFRFIGSSSPELESMTGNNHSVTNRLPLIQYLNYLYDSNAQAMICPLQNTPLNQSKSNISWLEATYAGSAFFGNKSLQEFNLAPVLSFSDFINSGQRYLSETEAAFNKMFKANEDSWTYIKNRLLLSNVNHLRIRRLLS